MKNKHRIKQRLSLLLAGALTFTNVGAALPAFAEDAPATPETASAATPETAEANVPTPNLSQITENLYDDLPDAPTGSYLGSMGLPVATGETKIGISAWVSDLYDGVDAHMDADGTPHEIMVYTMNAPYRDQLLPVSSRYNAVVLQGCLDAGISPQQFYDADEKYRKAYKARAAPVPKKHAPER